MQVSIATAGMMGGQSSANFEKQRLSKSRVNQTPSKILMVDDDHHYSGTQMS